MTKSRMSRASSRGISLLRARTSGVLLHPASLPGAFGIGDIGPAARTFVDLLAASKQSIWQMLPINPIDAHFSPYSTISSFATESTLVSIDDLVRDDLITNAESRALCRKPSGKIDYQWAVGAKRHALDLAWVRAQKKAAWTKRLLEYRRKEAAWIEDYSLFAALADYFDTKDWTTWPAELRTRQKAAMKQYRGKLAQEINRLIFAQLIFARQWQELRDHAKSRGVALMGDIPIFVGHESADVWAAQNQFLLKKNGRPSHVSGVPPDYFVKEGQRWGHALYDWKTMQKNGFAWWVMRFGKMLQLFDCVRVDHFIGFHRFWKIPAAAPTAKRGSWSHVPGKALFSALLRSLGPLPIIAEDLGLVTPEVHKLRHQFGFPGMRVLQFGVSESSDASFHLPFSYSQDSVVYPGTHDNSTINGWLSETTQAAKRGEKRAKKVLAILDTVFPGDRKNLHAKFLAAAHLSVANTSMLQLQDVLGLGSRARMNVPGTQDGNWTWRWQPQQSDTRHLTCLRELTSRTKRILL